MHESKWISLSSEDIAPPIHPEDALWAMESASPYDVPSYVRSKFDKASKTLAIEFRYLRKEDLKSVDLKEWGSAMIGSKSGRIWLLILNTDAIDRDFQILKEKVHSGVNRLSSTGATNGDIANRAIEGRSKTLFKLTMEECLA